MKKTTLLLLMILTVTSMSYAQSIIIGTGTDETTSIGSDPIDGYFNSFRYQTVYTAAELSASLTPNDEITALGWSISGDYAGGALLGYTIKIGHTTATNSSAHDTSTTQVVKNAFDYDPTVTTAGQFDMIAFDTNFVWNGVDNILVEVCSDGQNPFSGPYGQVRGTAAAGGDGSRRFRQDGGTSCGMDTNTSNSIKPNVQFNFIDGVPPACQQPSNLSVTNITDTTATISWDAVMDAEEYDVQVFNTGDDPSTAMTVYFGSTSGTMVTSTGLTGNTTYDAYVNSVCDVSNSVLSDLSGPFTFTTDCGAGTEPLFLTTSGGSFASEKWVSISTGPDNTGTIVYQQGPNYGDNSGLLDNVKLCLPDTPTTYYINAYDSFADGWDGTVYELTDAMGNIVANNGGETPNDGTNDDASGAFGDTQEQELEVSEMFTFPLICIDPTVSLENVEDCGSNQFSVDVTVSDLGSYSMVTVSDDQGSMSQNVDMANGVVTFGPYVSGTTINFTTSGGDAECDVMSSTSFTCPPPNDTFAGATPITPSAEGTGCSTATFNLPFLSDGTTDSGLDGTCSGSDTGLDQFFSWTATTDGLLFNSSNPGNPGIVVRDAMTMAEIDCAGTFATNAALSGWTVGQNLIIQIYDFDGTPNDVAFCLEEFTVPEPPANDSCATAEVVDGLPYNQDLDATAATNNDGFISCDGGSAHTNDGVWYTFTPSQSGEIDIDISNVVGWDPELRVYGGSCGTFTCVGFADSGGTGIGESINALPVTAFEQYWINVAYWSGITDNPEGPFTIDITGTAVLGTDDLTLNSDIRLFPNPATDVLNISGLTETSKVSVFNLLGQKVLTSDSNAINVSSLSNGMYIVNIEDENASKTLRFVKN